jgi:dCTP deaminase
MILTDREILVAIERGQIKIDPSPPAAAYSSTSVDLTLSRYLRVWKTPKAGGVEQIVCPAAKEYKFGDFSREFSESKEIGIDGYVIEPGVFVLGWTAEEIDLPLESRICARVEGKSSLARLGIGIHITAPTIHAGFPGQIQLEICNHGTLRIKLNAGMPVCQLIFEQTFGTPEKGYAGQFFQQKQS